ncbi:hypothetical protein ACE6H2_028278 [Prunus campanulata]
MPSILSVLSDLSVFLLMKYRKFQLQLGKTSFSLHRFFRFLFRNHTIKDACCPFFNF